MQAGSCVYRPATVAAVAIVAFLAPCCSSVDARCQFLCALSKCYMLVQLRITHKLLGLVVV